MRSNNRQVYALVNALVEHLGAAEATLAVNTYHGATTVFLARPAASKRLKPDTVVEYPNAFAYHGDAYGVRFYPHPIDGWIVGLEYEPTDDLFPTLLYQSTTAWRERTLQAAWEHAIDKHAGLWTNAKPVKQAREKPKPKEYLAKSIYVPLEQAP